MNNVRRFREAPLFELGFDILLILVTLGKWTTDVLVDWAGYRPDVEHGIFVWGAVLFTRQLVGGLPFIVLGVEHTVDGLERESHGWPKAAPARARLASDRSETR